MSRAAILPYPGDPYLLKYWLKYFNYWASDVDRLYIYHNSTIEPEMEAYIRRLCDHPKIKYIYEPRQIEHGEAIKRCLDLVTEDYIVLMEDDTYVFRFGIVDYCFMALESGNYDIVGSKRGSCATEILDRAKELWNLDYLGEGDQGPNFWPSFFFIKKENLLKFTSGNYGANAWKKGEYIKALDYVVKGDVIASDTFVLASLELRNYIPENRILYIYQGHAHPSDIEYYERGVYLFGGSANWIHVGSLSSGVGGILRDYQNRALIRRTVEEPKGETILEKWANTEMERREWERRVSFWLKFFEFAEDDHGSEEFYKLYGEAVYRIIGQYNLHIKTIRKFQNAYGTLGL